MTSDDEFDAQTTLADGTVIAVKKTSESDDSPTVVVETDKTTVRAAGSASDLQDIAQVANKAAIEPVAAPSNYDDGPNVDELTRRPHPDDDRGDTVVLTVEYYNPLVQSIVERYHFNFTEQDDGVLRYNGFLTELGESEFTKRFHDAAQTAFNYLEQTAGKPLETPFDHEKLEDYTQ
jgi:hypothetical protein